MTALIIAATAITNGFQSIMVDTPDHERREH